MFNQLVLLTLFVLSLSVIGKINGLPNDEAKHHATDYQRHVGIHKKSSRHSHKMNHENEEGKYVDHALRTGELHHRKFKTRQGNGTSCTNICVDAQLAAVASWFNGTEDLHFIYNILSLCFGPGPILTNSSLPVSVEPNSTSPLPETNVTLPIPGRNLSFPFSLANPFPIPNGPAIQIPSPKYPIFSCLARHFGKYFSAGASISEIVKKIPEFIIIWKEFLFGLTGGCNKTAILTENLKDLFGCHGTFLSNFFNLSNWEHPFSLKDVLEKFPGK